MQRLTRTHYQLIGQLVEAKQHFLENIPYKCNTLTQELKTDNGISSVFGATMLTLLTDDLASMLLENLSTLLQKLGKYRFKDSEKLANSIKKAIQNSYCLKQMSQESIDIILSVLVTQIRGIEKVLKT